MSDHFAAFSFVDRITGLVPGTRARARFAIPAAIAAFPSCLVAEAVGQLAAWVAMSHIGFRGRPVAALARETRFVRAAKPGEVLDLAVEIEDCDDEAVAYRGWADVEGERAIELSDCLGPMLPAAEFDSPEELAAVADFRRHQAPRQVVVRGIHDAQPPVDPRHLHVVGRRRRDLRGGGTPMPGRS